MSSDCEQAVRSLTDTQLDRAIIWTYDLSYSNDHLLEPSLTLNRNGNDYVITIEIPVEFNVLPGKMKCKTKCSVYNNDAYRKINLLYDTTMPLETIKALAISCRMIEYSELITKYQSYLKRETFPEYEDKQIYR